MADCYKQQQRDFKRDLIRSVRQSGQLNEINQSESDSEPEQKFFYLQTKHDQQPSETTQVQQKVYTDNKFTNGEMLSAVEQTMADKENEVDALHDQQLGIYQTKGVKLMMNCGRQ